MIRVVGAQKILGLILMAGLVALMVAYWLYILKPKIQENQKRLSINSSEVNQMRADLEDLTTGLEKFEQQKVAFKRIEDIGFFDSQNRPEARQRITAMQQESRLLSAKFSIEPAKTELNEKAAEAGYKILNTSISFNLEAIEDQDIYKFVYLLNYGFPGEVTIERLSISRDIEVTQPVLRKIGIGDPIPLVTGFVKVNWRTMVVDPSLSVNNNHGEGAFEE